MSKKNVDDYLTEGIHGTRLPNQAERDYFLGTLRERIVLALKIGEVMQDKGLEELEQGMKKYPNATLIFNGQVASKFQVEEKKIAQKLEVPYTTITNNENKTDIGAVLTLDKAIDKQRIYLEDLETIDDEESTSQSKKSNTTPFFQRIKHWFS